MVLLDVGSGHVLAVENALNPPSADVRRRGVRGADQSSRLVANRPAFLEEGKRIRRLRLDGTQNASQHGDFAFRWLCVLCWCLCFHIRFITYRRWAAGARRLLPPVASVQGSRPRPAPCRGRI